MSKATILVMLCSVVNGLSQKSCSCVVTLYTVIVASIYNLAKGNGDSNLWTVLLASYLGYLLLNLSIKCDEHIF